MSEYTCYLITIYYKADKSLIRCALKTKEPEEYPMETMSRYRLWEQLPAWVQSCGEIVAVEEIFEIEVKK